jgi:hypothetical protein
VHDSALWLQIRFGFKSGLASNPVSHLVSNPVACLASAPASTLAASVLASRPLPWLPLCFRAGLALISAALPSRLPAEDKQD